MLQAGTLRTKLGVTLGLLSAAGVAAADVFENYDAFGEGFLGETFYSNGVTYRDTNTVDAVFPDGSTTTAAELGQQLIIERAVPLYVDFPGYGSPNNGLTFGSTYVNGDNLSIGALAETWMDLDEPGSSATLDIAYYENGPWGGIVFHLDALSGGSVVASDTYTLANGGGRDNADWRTLSVSAPSFDSLHLYATFGEFYSAPRGIIDNLSITAVPEPGALSLLGLAGVFTLRRR